MGKFIGMIKPKKVEEPEKVVAEMAEAAEEKVVKKPTLRKKSAPVRKKKGLAK